MSKSNVSRAGRRRIAGERTTGRQGTQKLRQVEATAAPPDPSETVAPPADAAPPKLSLVPPPDGRPRAAGDPEPVETPEADRTEREEGTRSRQPGRGPSTLLLAGLAVLAAVVVAAAAYFAVPAWRARGVEQAQSTAPSVAERAAKAILSYDYRSLGHDEKTAAGYLTPSYRKKYENTFALVKEHAPALKAKVTAQVLGSGISQADADHAHVLLFVNQTTNSKANPGQPQVALNRVMLDMVRQQGTWLVNGITSY